MRTTTPGPEHGRRFAALLCLLCLLLPLLAGCHPGSSPGERLYRRHCDTCHGVDGSGGYQYLTDPGANLLDGVWRYGGDRTSIETTLRYGAVAEHPSWDFTYEEYQQLVEFTLKLSSESY